jgi:hypothetical protein
MATNTALSCCNCLKFGRIAIKRSRVSREGSAGHFTYDDMEDEDFAQFSQDVGLLSLSPFEKLQKRRKVILSQSDSEMDVGADPGINIANLSQHLTVSSGIEIEFTRLQKASQGSEDLENDDVEFRPRSSGPADSDGSLKTFIGDSEEDEAISAPPFYAMPDDERAQLEREPVRL